MGSEAVDRDEARPERALALLAGLLILAASGRVALPLVVFVALVALLAAPMSSVIAWLSRFDGRPQGDEETAEGDGLAQDRPELEVPFVHARIDPLPRPVRPHRDDN